MFIDMDASNKGAEDVRRIGEVTDQILQDTKRKRAKRAGVNPAEIQEDETGEYDLTNVLAFPYERIVRKPRGWEF